MRLWKTKKRDLMFLLHHINHLSLFCKGLRKAKIKEKFKKFVELLRKIHINILFRGSVSKPVICQFFNEILSNMRILEDNYTMVLSGECNTIIQNKLQPKLKYPGSFQFIKLKEQ